MSQKYILYANLQTIGRLNCFAETHAPREDGAPPFKQGDLTVLQKPVPPVENGVPSFKQSDLPVSRKLAKVSAPIIFFSRFLSLSLRP